MWQLRALPIAIINMVVIMLIWIILTPVEELLSSITFPLPFIGFLICLAGVLVIHELIHAVVHPLAGYSTHSIIGFWPARMLLYATYDGEISRNRFVAILLMPSIVISIIPILIAAVTQILNVWVVYITILNAFLASGDVWAVSVILRLPTDAIIRTHGHDAYWREKAGAK